MKHTIRATFLASCGLLALAQPTWAAAAEAAAESGAADAGNPIGNADDIVVSATRVNAETPITASVHTFQRHVK